MVGTHVWSASRDAAVLSGIALALVAAVLVSLTVGAIHIPLADVVAILTKPFGSDRLVDEIHSTVLLNIRLPRLLLTVLVGGTLGLCGAALQGLFRNPIVEPGLIGVSGGAAAMVVLFVVFGSVLSYNLPAVLREPALSLAAFAGSFTAMLLVVGLARHQARTNMALLILSGVAVNTLCSAIIGTAVFYADENQLRTFTFWTLGDLGGATMPKLMLMTPVLVLAATVLLRQSRALNAIALGEGEAFHLGVNVERVKYTVVLACALGVGVCVSAVGMIGFVGLVVPHVIRTAFHTDHTLVMPASMLGGALLLVLADMVARVVVAPAELPIGVVTALLGAPFFIALIYRAKQRGELAS